MTKQRVDELLAALMDEEPDSLCAPIENVWLYLMSLGLQKRWLLAKMQLRYMAACVRSFVPPERDAEFVAEVWRQRNQKGADYTQGDADSLKNFKTRAAEAGCSWWTVWSIYAGKHMDAVRSYLKHGQLESEPILGRLVDLMVYSALGQGLLEDMDNGA